jgi:queuine tRNA-ribosyltransferase
MFMNWPKPILTDSGGYQVFSLAGTNDITDEGVSFKSHIDGSRHFISPEKAMQIQNDLGADIIMAFDECCSYDAGYEYAQHSIQRTHEWLIRCIASHKNDAQALFGIVQGGMHSELRRQSAEQICSHDLPGYAIGGLSVGEPKEAMLEMLACQAPLLPKAKPRYLMGVGALYDLVEAVSLGIDMFDCVMQTRMARTGSAMAGLGRINLKNAAYKRDFAPIADDCSCYVCTNYTKAYLRHLVMGREMLASMLLSYHNIAYTAQYMAKIRKSIIEGGLQSLLARERAKWAELNR